MLGVHLRFLMADESSVVLGRWKIHAFDVCF
jgi:hypothetical protein